MKKIAFLLSLIFIAMSLSIILSAYDKPELEPNYLDTEGGTNNASTYFTGMHGHAIKLTNSIIGENAYWNAHHEEVAEIAEKLGIDMDVPQGGEGAPTDEQERQFQLALLKYRKIEPTYDMIQVYGITKEQFIEANEKLDEEDKYTDEEIELLYGGDINALLQYAKNPLSYVYGDEIFCFNEVMTLDYAKQYEMYTRGDFGDYLKEMKEKTTTVYSEEFNPYFIEDLEMEWLNYTSWRLESGEKPETSPETGDAAPMLIVIAFASAVTAAAFRRRREVK